MSLDLSSAMPELYFQLEIPSNWCKVVAMSNHEHQHPIIRFCVQWLERSAGYEAWVSLLILIGHDRVTQSATKVAGGARARQ
jgi:hypothetical protein